MANPGQFLYQTHMGATQTSPILSDLKQALLEVSSAPQQSSAELTEEINSSGCSAPSSSPATFLLQDSEAV